MPDRWNGQQKSDVVPATNAWIDNRPQGIVAVVGELCDARQNETDAEGEYSGLEPACIASLGIESRRPGQTTLKHGEGDRKQSIL